ncbi:MAG: stage II sporulation protein M [Thermoguttaceae bacterium]
MKVSDLLDSRRANWHELEHLCSRLEGKSRRTIEAPAVSRFATLYRAACADLALADAYQFPPGTIQYLHQLVGRAHNQLYRSHTFRFGTWLRQLFLGVPQRLFNDNALRLAFCIFWGPFLLSMFLAYSSREYAEQVMGDAMLGQLEENFSKPMAGRDPNENLAMAGFYIQHNGTIGLQCFAFGMFFGIGGLVLTISNAQVLGAAFGHMAGTEQWENFSNFVTAHGPFELTGIVLMSAAGMRLGFSMIDTRGLTRSASLERAAEQSVPTMCAGVMLFGMAAVIEAFLSPTAAPYALKVAVAAASVLLMLFYFVILGYPRRADYPGKEQAHVGQAFQPDRTDKSGWKA